MKAGLQRILQNLLGFDRYLWLFTLYKLRTLRKDRSENDFFYFLEMIPAQTIVLDIGANLGLMSYYLCQTKHQVYAFEPIPNNLKILHRLKKKFKLKNLSIEDYALGNFEGDIELVLPVVKGVKKQGLSHVRAEKMTDFNEGENFVTRVHRLDDIETFKDKSISAIKIDVENFEYEVFLGAKDTIIKNKPIIYCELWDNQNRQDCFDFFRSIQYDIRVLEQGRLIDYQEAVIQTQNFFFIPQSH